MECLLTTLNDAVNDSSLRKIDEFSIIAKKASGSSVRNIKIAASNNPTTITVGDGEYFTDSNGTANYGRTVTIAPTLYSTDKYFTNNDQTVLTFNNKTDITYLICRGYRTEFADYESMGLPGLKYLTIGYVGDISYLKYNPQLVYLAIAFNNATGNISVVSNLVNLEKVDFDSRTKVFGNISSLSALTNLHEVYIHANAVSGNISSLSGLQLTTLNLSNSAVSGNLSSLSSMTTLTSLKLDDTAVTGDTSALANLTNLTTFTYTNTAITGTWPLT